MKKIIFFLLSIFAFLSCNEEKFKALDVEYIDDIDYLVLKSDRKNLYELPLNWNKDSIQYFEKKHPNPDKLSKELYQKLEFRNYWIKDSSNQVRHISYPHYKSFTSKFNEKSNFFYFKSLHNCTDIPHLFDIERRKDTILITSPTSPEIAEFIIENEKIVKKNHQYINFDDGSKHLKKSVKYYTYYENGNLKSTKEIIIKGNKSLDPFFSLKITFDEKDTIFKDYFYKNKDLDYVKTQCSFYKDSIKFSDNLPVFKRVVLHKKDTILRKFTTIK
ncbi:hypothetical protein [Aureivirga sp. CE67]|uniref:hypothetical protein n=1 Tax=Aureivirga sp. CE67 TaxID=1788983 RepID=UPI0018C9D8D8|nr:hypothetical protein [Aureivirga sp. CE67]